MLRGLLDVWLLVWRFLSWRDVRGLLDLRRGSLLLVLLNFIVRLFSFLSLRDRLGSEVELDFQQLLLLILQPSVMLKLPLVFKLLHLEISSDLFQLLLLE
jgi:hypothetical protein